MTCVRLPARRRTARPTVRGLRRAASAMAWWDRHRLFEDAHGRSCRHRSQHDNCNLAAVDYGRESEGNCALEVSHDMECCGRPHNYRCFRKRAVRTCHRCPSPAK
jgi:hypothetical protein